MNTWQYNPAATFINFPAGKHVIIYAFQNFIYAFLRMTTWWDIYTATFLQMNTSWYIHTATLYQLSCRWTCDDIYIHTATLYQLSCKWTPDDLYIPQLYINFPADKHLMIYTYRNFISIFLQMNSWWYINTATLYQFSCRWTPDDIYIPQLYINFPADEHLIIYTYRNFIWTFLQMTTW